MLLLIDGFTPVTNNKRKRGHSKVDFTALLLQQKPMPLHGIATGNYFYVLKSMRILLESKVRIVPQSYVVDRQPIKRRRVENSRGYKVI
ncbi:hypothetical protein Plhal304r1_c028g0092901 [Plasmopara halstedii]